MNPQLLTETLGKRQCLRDADQVEAEGNEHQIGQHIKRDTHRQLAGERQAQPAERTGNGAGRRVADNAAAVVGQMQDETRRTAHRQRTDNPAAHANAMRTAQQADQEQGEVSRG